MRRVAAAVSVTLAILFPIVARAGQSNSAASYDQLVQDDAPVAYWRFEDSEGDAARSPVGESDRLQLLGVPEGQVQSGQAGPRPPEYPLFDRQNAGVLFAGERGFLRVADPGDDSPLDFDLGDAITIEAWVKPRSLNDGQQVYIVGKGRTNNPGFAGENQNYALRLRGMNGTARVSFLFRNAGNRVGVRDDFHRWNSDLGFSLDGAWHHVAVVYVFGQPDAIRAYVDGRETGGRWDLGGPTTSAPVVDNDELWIGSSLGGGSGNTFHGWIDEVAIYRHALPAARLQQRYAATLPDPREAELAGAAELPADVVTVDLHEGIPAGDAWTFGLGERSFRYQQPTFAFVGIPKKYNAHGVIDDRTNPFLLRARARVTVRPEDAGPWQLLLRGKGAARLMVDGRQVAQTSFMSRNASGHEEVPELAAGHRQQLRPLPPGCQECLAECELTPGEHVFRLDAMVGGKGLRLELDELCVAVARGEGPFQLLSADGPSPIPLTERAWYAHAASLGAQLRKLDAGTRRSVARQWEAHWARRHALAREIAATWPDISLPELPASWPVHNDIDRFVGARLVAAAVQPGELTDDFEFLRRATLDTRGLVPTRAQITAFIEDEHPRRRSRVIDRLLDDPSWADHWVGYWQDVLAENPGILKPKLNNSGPFRWWIHESFLDNKPMDRLVTELVLMEGSKYYGGPAGFGMATQNDVPLAAKAHVLAKAFLGIEMKCARCHDAPYHPFKQEELFSLAAMLHRAPLELPQTSTVPAGAGDRKPLIEVSLRPGDTIAPLWPFPRLAPDLPAEELLLDAEQEKENPRARLAATLTSPHNHRFAEVMVNRLWKRYLGRGLVDPVDDWEGDQRGSHPELLAFLAREFVMHGYDLKHVARLILNSHTYQRRVVAVEPEQVQLFATPVRRRMTAEQLVDSLFAAAGKSFSSEPLTLDPEGRRPVETFLNLGAPTRAWQFTSLSNERDRPALALPVAQSIIDVLVMFGWRDARPHPLTERDETPTVLQPLTLANGVVGRRVVRFSDDSTFTRLCLQDVSLPELIDQVCLQVVSRPASDEERVLFLGLLAEGFEKRIRPGAAGVQHRQRRTAVSWSNHLSAAATKIKLELERKVNAGDPPTTRLDSDWRERMEDMVWALFNTPEFAFVP